MSTKRRVVVTGLGLVSPLGVGVQPTWENLLAGKSGIRRITKFDPTDYACQIAGEVRSADEEGGFDASNWISSKDQKKMGQFIHYGIAASHEALEQAGLLDLDENDPMMKRIGVALGSGIGGLPEVEAGYETLSNRGPRRVSPFFIPSILINMLSGHVSMRYGFKGPNTSVVTACATATHAIGTSLRMIQDGEADVVVSGGAEACVCPSAVAGFAAAKALSTKRNDDPEKACRPFDEDRDGFVMAEGAGVLVLEEYEHAKKRGATILAELSGFAQTADAYHMTTPHPDAEGSRRATELALEDAGMKPENVTYVNAHATSTPAGDVTESKMIESVFGKDVLVSATKSMTGHSLGATGGWEAAFCVLAIQNGMVPPTINLENVSEGCNLDYVSGEARKVEVKAAVSNNFGFGGTNASLVFEKVE